MPTENRKILIRRGTGSPPSDVVQGELLLRTDTDGIATNKVFIGTGTGTAKAIANLTDMGVTATSTQLNYVSDVTSNVQSQLNTLNNGKAALAGADFTGAVTVQAPSADMNPATRVYVDTAISNLVNNADSALDTLGELASALDDDANFASTVTTSLASKAAKNNAALTGTPTAPTATAGTSTTQLATTAFVTGAINDVSGFTPASVEWNFVEKVTFTSGTSFTINNNALTSNPFSTSGGNDFKFVIEITTTAEDNDAPTLRLNGNTGDKYNYIVTDSIATNPSSDSASANPLAKAAYEQTSIPFCNNLSSLSDNVSLTHFHSEIIVSHQTFRDIPGFQDDATNLIVNGTAMITAMESSTSGAHKVWPSRSDFSGNLFIGDAYFSSLTITHNLDAGSNDNAVVRIYKRAR